MDVALMRSLVVVLLLLTAAPAFAQDRVIGLLSLPQIFGPRQCAPFEPEDVPLHASPNDGHAFASIRVDQNHSFAPHGGCEGLKVSVHQGEQRLELPTLEYDYEMPAAIVVDQRDGWFKIRLGERAAWLKASTADRFMPLKDLYEEFVGVTAIRSSAGRLANVPGGAAGPILPQVRSSQAVYVLEIRGEWVRVEVLSNSACTAANDGPPEVVATGWLPLHDAKGEPTVWFSSRGC
jgi:hypothetical protein